MIEKTDDKVLLTGCHAFSPEQTFNCGQCFRFEKGRDGVFEGIAFGRCLRVGAEQGGTAIYCTSEEFDSLWRRYFDLDRDYCRICDKIGDDAYLKKAAEYGSGIRILRQEPWETLASFIFSQCNNIPRIKGIIKKFCELYGEDGAFPTPEKTAALTLADLEPLKAGYRAPYILSAARAVVSGTLDLQGLSSPEVSAEESEEKLLELPGVGKKVAACVLLFGLGKTAAFPVDTWIRKTFSVHYPQGFDPKKFGEDAGIVQQYLFFYALNWGKNREKRG